jgi:hypothetical protein
VSYNDLPACKCRDSGNSAFFYSCALLICHVFFLQNDYKSSVFMNFPLALAMAVNTNLIVVPFCDGKMFWFASGYCN